MEKKKNSLNYILFILIFAEVIIFIMVVIAGINSNKKEQDSVNDSFSMTYEDFDFSGSLKEIKVNSILIVKNGINISYSFDNTNFIGDSISIDLWVVNETGGEVERERDTFSIKKEGEIEREVFIDLTGNAGNNLIYVALTEEPSNFIKSSLVLNDKSITGNIVAIEGQKTKMTIYSIFLLIVGIAIFFIARERNKEDVEIKSKNKNK